MEEIDYNQAKEAPQYPVFKGGLYVCEIISSEEQLEAEYKGQPNPHYTLKVKPLKMATGDPEMYGTDGEVRESEYETGDGELRERYIFLNVTHPLKITDNSTFGKIYRAITNGDGKVTKYVEDNFKSMQDFVGQKIVCSIAVKEKMDGTPKNVIESITNCSENKVIDEEEKKESEEKKKEEV